MRSLLFTAILLSFCLIPLYSSVNDEHFISTEKLTQHVKLQKDFGQATIHPDSSLIAVIDTGIDLNHPYIKRNLFISSSKKAQSGSFGFDFSKGVLEYNQRPFDENGHGTHIAGIIEQVFPEAHLLILKYYKNGNTDNQNFTASLNAFKKAILSSVSIINYSGGGPGADPREKSLLELAKEKDILLVTAAGNNGEDIDEKQNYFPANYDLDNILVVMAHDEMQFPLESSNFGAKTVAISAPGHKIDSAYLKGTKTKMTGTSQATAYVTAVAGILRNQFPQFNASQIKQIIIDSAKKNKAFVGKNKAQGMIHLPWALQLAQEISQKGAPAQAATPTVSLQ